MMGNLYHDDIVLLGLGPGEKDLLTVEAMDWLSRVNEIVLCHDAQFPEEFFPPGLKIIYIEDEGEQADTSQDEEERRMDALANRVVDLGKRPQGVTFALPGHPIERGGLYEEIHCLAEAIGLRTRIIQGVSYIDSILSALGQNYSPKVILVDADELMGSYIPHFPPSSPALILNIINMKTADKLKACLLKVYQPSHPVHLVHRPGSPGQIVEEIQLKALNESIYFSSASAAYLPQLEQGTSFEEFQDLIAHLRAPEGCPWDRKQTHQTLRPYLLEEAYEVLAALDANDMKGLKEELGDLLLQVVLHAQVAAEDGNFRMVDVLQHIHEKLVRRHPHVFGDTKVDGVARVLQNWEEIKAAERKAHQEEEKSLLDSVPGSLPSLSQAQEIQERAARVGFDWPNIEPVWDKVDEELCELREAGDSTSREAEIGDLFFAVVNLARWYRVDAESALRKTIKRFRRRFGHIERSAKVQGQALTEMTLEEMDEFWDEAKKKDDEGHLEP